MRSLEESTDYAPRNLLKSRGTIQAVIMEDNDAVIKMIKKGRAPTTSHIARTHRVILDWLLEIFNNDRSIYMRYCDTTQQLADILTKAPFVSMAMICENWICTAYAPKSQ